VASRSTSSVLEGVRRSFVLHEHEVPAPGAGEFLVRTELVGICATDTHIYKGEVPGIPYPVILGHEFVGTIEALGPGVTTDTDGTPVAVGDRVVPMPATPCGTCPECVIQPGPVVNCPNYDVFGFSEANAAPLGGGLSQIVHARNPRTRFFRTDLPAGVAVLAEPFATPIHGVERVGIEPGDTVLVQGPGTVGLLSIAAAITAGASKVIVIGGPPKRLAMARAFGASVTIDIAEVRDSEERIRLVRDATPGGRGVDVVIEAAGVPAAVIEGISTLRNGGRFCELGHFSDVGTVALNPYRHLLANNITLVGSSGYGPRHFQRSLRILERGAFPFGSIVTHRLPLARVDDAINALTPERGWVIDGEEVGKVTIDPTLL